MSEGMAGQGGRGVDGAPGLVDSVAVLVRGWRLIVGAGAVAGAVAAVILLVATPRQWESVATVVIVPPKLASELQPAALTVQGYQKLLESGSVIAETRRRLAERGQLDSSEPLRLGKEIESRIFVSRRAEETSLSPMVQAVAYGATAEQAAAIANVWTQVFLEKAREMTAGATSPMVEFIEARFADSGRSLTAAEAERLRVVAGYSARHDAAADRWDREITARKARGNAEVAAYRAESSRLVAALVGRGGLETRRAQLATARQSLGELSAEMGRVSGQLARQELELDAARRQLAATPPLVEVRKAITDDALWQASASPSATPVDWRAIAGRTLVSQEVNPLHTELSSAVARLEMETGALKPRFEQLSALGADLARSIDERQQAIDADEAAVTALREERTAGEASMTATNASEIGILDRARSRELAAVRAEWDTEVGRLDRTITAERELFASLAEAHNQTLMARTEPGTEDIRLASPAVPPQLPEPRGALLKSVLAAALAALIGAFFVMAREARARGEQRA